MKKIDLEQIYNQFDCLSIIETYTSLVDIKGNIIMAMKEACKQTLELAAENALIHKKSNWGRYETVIPDESDLHEIVKDIKINNFGQGDCNYTIITTDKQSILDTINQIE